MLGRVTTGYLATVLSVNCDSAIKEETALFLGCSDIEVWYNKNMNQRSSETLCGGLHKKLNCQHFLVSRHTVLS